jgi:tripartite-type tricarboxylate transporter receptor subunit TctC
VLELNRAGDLRVLAVTGPDRLVGGPELPTAVEPCLVWSRSIRSGNAKEMVDRIDRATRNAMSDPKW